MGHQTPELGDVVGLVTFPLALGESCELLGPVEGDLA
jgi:hypothetical protein